MADDEATSSRPRAPIFLLADSMPLFASTVFADVAGLPSRPATVAGGSRCWWDAVVGGAVDAHSRSAPRKTACYLGASNGDEPAFYAMFVSAAAKIGFPEGCCRHVRAAATADDVRCIAEEASLIVLAGGDPLVGWRAFQAAGVDVALRAAHARGDAILVGISAGAEHLGTHGYVEPIDERLLLVAERQRQVAAGAPIEPLAYPTLGLVPYFFAPHEEDTDWARSSAAFADLAPPATASSSGGQHVQHDQHNQHDQHASSSSSKQRGGPSTPLALLGLPFQSGLAVLGDGTVSPFGKKDIVVLGHRGWREGPCGVRESLRPGRWRLHVDDAGGIDFVSMQ